MSATDNSLAVMTFNLLYAQTEPPNSWPERRPIVANLLRRYQPDVLGTQEGLYTQIKDMTADLRPDYDWIGLGREGGSRGEFMAVFFRRQRLEPLAFDHIWLSDTPRLIGSMNWDNHLPRMLTWVRFRDLQTGGEMVFLNTHLSRSAQAAREKSVGLILKTADELADAPHALLVGDFNSASRASKVYDLLTQPGGFCDTWREAKQGGTLTGTKHDFHGPSADNEHIDWILRRGPMETLWTEVIADAEAGRYPSDHFPVLARLVLTLPWTNCCPPS